MRLNMKKFLQHVVSFIDSTGDCPISRPNHSRNTEVLWYTSWHD